MEIIWQEWAAYAATGAAVGVLAGLFGIGGGLVVVPVLTTVLAWYLDTPHIVHLAIGTSLATILATSLASVRAHHRHGMVEWTLARQLSVGILAGAFLGGWASQFLSAEALADVFAALEALIGVYFLLAVQPEPHRQLPSMPARIAAGSAIGFLASLVGIGGGTLTTPWLVWHNVPVHRAIATAAACSLPVALAGTLGFFVGGLQAHDLPPGATGYIYWPAFFGIVAFSMLTARYGVWLAHRLPARSLKRFFGFFLLLLAAKMAWF